MNFIKKYSLLFYFTFSLFNLFSQDTVTSKIFISTEKVTKEVEVLNPEAYKTRYNEEDLLYKIVDNYGNKYDKLYGTRNVRPILHGIAYRGGANNYYHKTSKRKNQNPLPDDGLLNLCQEGFSSSVYLYRTNADTAYTEVKCNCIDGESNRMEYVQLDYFDKDHIYEMLKMVYESATNKEKGPVYLHCWNGWHASGFLAAVMLKQFCGYNDIDAVAYWDLGTDGANTSPHYQTIRKKIRDFEPYPEFIIKDSLGERVCPPMPKGVDRSKAHIDIEQLLIVPEAIPLESRIILYDVIFAPNATTIPKVDSLKEIKTLVAALKKYTDLKVEIGGHTDRSGSEASNKTLSTNRAKYIYNLLLKNGISKSRITYKGYGSSMPAYSNSTKEGRTANRRIEVKIIEKRDFGSDKLVNEEAYEKELPYQEFTKIDLKEVKKDKRYVLTSVVFEPNATSLPAKENAELKKLVKLLETNSNIELEIAGYTDASGIKEKNDSLSEARAKSVYLYLVEKGINPTRLTYKGFGPLNPIADNKYRWGRDKNRRIEVKVLKL